MFSKLRLYIIHFKNAIYHAAYHRNMRKAELAKTKKDLKAFRKYIYRAEDAWRKIIINKELKLPKK